jgi:hypothetical protein
MIIEPDPGVASDGNFEVEDQFRDSGYLAVYAGGYDGYVELNRAQVEQVYQHLKTLLGGA